MISLHPFAHRLHRLLGRASHEVDAAAVESWEIAPGDVRAVSPVIVLPGQIDRITRTEFETLEHLTRVIDGDPAERFAPTTAYRLRDVALVDGTLYSGHVALHLRPRQKGLRVAKLAREAGTCCLYETWLGNRYFGNWLLNDCLSYRLTDGVGDAVTTMQEGGDHISSYETLLGITPRRIGDTHFETVILFDDYANNSNRLARAQDMRRRLLQGRSPQTNPGVFLLRRQTGDQRCLQNEQEIAEHLEARFGFRAMYPPDHSVAELADACGGASIIAGVEGSQLVHGIAAMAPGGTLLTLQPPDRATTSAKLLTDRMQQRFAMIVGYGDTRSYRIDLDDVSRTMDVIGASHPVSR